MKKVSGILFFMALIISASAIQSRVSAQDDPIAGGYGEMHTGSTEALRDARFAVMARARKTGQRIELVKILEAEQQVVAGMNYRIRMRVMVNRTLKNVTVVVYQNLKNRYSLTSWRAAN